MSDVGWALSGIILLVVLPVKAQPSKPKLGDTPTGSRAQPAHIIPLRDAHGDTIQQGDRLALPFSVIQTCGGECHDVAAIARGWHFDAGASHVPPGRPGQPWLLVDRLTSTVAPLSYRSWPGTYRPKQLGIGGKEFALRFGARTTAGIGPEDKASSADRLRWDASGVLEPNCLACHDASAAYDQAGYAHQVALQNFRYAATAASGLGVVTGSARDMPDMFDYLLPNSVTDALQTKIPRVQYAPAQFLPDGKVAFDIVRDVKSNRCYYCHTNVDVEFAGAARWKDSQDVHMARGLTCQSCHQHGLDHMVSRNDDHGSLSCEGCHREGNAAGAPHPAHAGIPPVHFAKMTCTACHSGPVPERETRRVKTSMTHGLGEFNSDKSPDAEPHIYYPVFAREAGGKLAPNRGVWPAFWGRLAGGQVIPIPLTDVTMALRKAKRNLPAEGTALWVEQALPLLGDGAVYISGGKLHRLDRGKIVTEEHRQAQPYLWPIAHDVRPATRALGATGCQDCHSIDAPIFFGNVTVDSPIALERAQWKMNRFEQDLDAGYQARLAQSWRYRGWLKAVGLGAAGMLILVLVAYAVRAVGQLSAATIGKPQ